MPSNKKRAKRKPKYRGSQISPRAFGMYRHVLRGKNRNAAAKGKDKHLMRGLPASSRVKVSGNKKIIMIS